MDCKKLYGVVCASVTPMRADGAVDYEGVRRLTRHLVGSGIHCLYPNGTNGESLSLTRTEREEIARAIQAENAGRSVLYIQCGAATVEESYAHVRFAQRLGADGAGLMTPVFFPMDDEAMRLFFDAILPSVRPMPVYAYNIPSRTGNDLSAELLGELMDAHDNLLGVKYSAADMVRLGRYANACASRRASVLVGSDAMAMCCIASGGDGWVSGPSAVFARRHVMLYEAMRRGDWEAARAIELRICETARRMQDIPEIPAIKYMLARMGVIGCDACRAPLRPLARAERARLDALLAEYRAEG